MRIDDNVRDALKKLILLHGNATRLAKALNVAHTTVLAWTSGKVDEISGDVWYEKLEPEIRPYLKEAPSPSEETAPPPASSLNFVQRLRKQPQLRPIETAILEKLRAMSESQLAKVYSDIVYNAELEACASACDRGSAYSSSSGMTLLVFPEMASPEKLRDAETKLKSLPGLAVLRHGAFEWRQVRWSLCPAAETKAFDEFLTSCFSQPLPYVVEKLLPLSKPFCFVIRSELDLEAVRALLKKTFGDENFHLTPYIEAVHCRCAF